MTEKRKPLTKTGQRPWKQFTEINNVWLFCYYYGRFELVEIKLIQLIIYELYFVYCEIFRSAEYESRLSLLQETVREYEVSQLALDCIKTGESPLVNGK